MELRSSEGFLKAEFGPVQTGWLLEGVKGHWTNKSFKPRKSDGLKNFSGTVNCFVFDVDAVIGPTQNFKIFIWKGDYLRS